MSVNPLESLSHKQVLIGERGELIPHSQLSEIYRGTIKPQPGKPTVVLPADFRIGRVESGFSGKPPDAILYINAAGIAGDGPTTQSLQVSEGLKHIARSVSPHIPLHYVGLHNKVSDFAETEYTGSLPQQLVEIPDGAKTIPEQFKAITDSLTDAVRILARQGKANILAVSTGYTSFVPYGIKEAIKIVKGEGYPDLKAIVVNQDSSLPDTDNPSYDLDPQTGYPLDRFYHPGYKSNEDVTVWLLTNQLFEFNIKHARHRAPDGILTAATAFPFTPEYLQKWANWRKVSKKEARLKLSEMIRQSQPELANALTQDIIFISLFASGGYFNSANIGKWMTAKQYMDMKVGSKTLVQALVETAKRARKPVIISGVEGFVNLADSFNIPEVTTITKYSVDGDSPKVLLVRVPRFKQPDYGVYHRAADMAIHRTTQANTAAETLLAGIPQLVLTMPAGNYMDAAKTDRVMYVRGLRQYQPTVNPAKLGERIADIVMDPGYAAALVDQADNLFLQHHMNPGTNFFAVLGHIAGFPVN